MFKRVSKILSLLFTGILIAAAFSGCEADYSNSVFYTMGKGEFQADLISEIEIDWEAGEIAIYPCEGTKLYFFEESSVPLSANTSMHHFFDGITLHIRAYKGGVVAKNLPAKKLSVYIPTSYIPKTTMVNTVSANVTIPNVALKAFNFSSVSGSLNYEGALNNSIYFETVSGQINISTSVVTPIIGGKSVSGNATIRLPSNAKFAASVESLSGTFISDFSVINTGTMYVHEGTDSMIQLKSTSGNLIVLKRD